MTPTRTPQPTREVPTLQQLVALCRDPRHHCALVLAVNAGLALCAAAEPFAPTLLLHLALLPVNTWRLLRACRTAAAAAPRDGVEALQRRAAEIRCAPATARGSLKTVRLAPLSAAASPFSAGAARSAAAAPGAR
jgi:hypothetical protein